tara:strand:- start:17717 stop:18013 length:297 start_codon:yes stop_codon:yes gene_type:complete
MNEYQTPKAMKRIGNLFDRYKNHFKPPQASVEKEVREVIKEITGFSLELGKINYTVSTKTISLKVPSVLKTEIMFKQEEILSSLKDKLGKDSSPQKIF